MIAATIATGRRDSRRSRRRSMNGQRDQDREQDVRDADRAEHDRVGPLEDPEQIEEEVEEPVRARDEVGRPRVGLLREVGAEPAGILGALGGEVPDAGEADDHA